MKKKADYSYNIFENVSKEQFIDEVNNTPVKFREYKVHNYKKEELFNRVNLLKNYLDDSIDSFTDITFFEAKVHYLFFYLSFEVIRDSIRIIDIENYEEEVNVFNSFNPIVKVDDRIFILVNNLNEYLKFRGKNGISLYSYSSRFVKCHRANLTAFLNMIKKEDKEKITAEVKIELDKVEQEFISKLDECLIDFKDFNGVIKFDTHNCNIHFWKYYDYIRLSRLTKKHLIENDLFDEFTIRFTQLERLESYFNRIDFKSHPLREYSYDKVKTVYDNYMDCFESFADYIGYEMIVEGDAKKENVSMTTNIRIKFKKIV